MNAVTFAVTSACAVLIVYHHLLYPLLLGLLARSRAAPSPAPELSGYEQVAAPRRLPRIHLIVPACNEAAFVADKIRNIGALDYPPQRLEVTLVCDGCADDTAALARAAALEPENAHLHLEVREYAVNRGKVAVLNQAIQGSCADIVALSDTSALVSVDALGVAVAHFRDGGVGVVSGGYGFLEAATPGEAAYWRYQGAIKRRESALGSVIGVHGAFYLFRRRLFSPLEPDTINDDFILPMRIVAAGHRAVYEPRIAALELERANPALESSRRRRIAAGNVQQVLRLAPLLSPRHGLVALNFASGKALRVLMPFCLLGLLAGSLALAPTQPSLLLLAAAQLAVYGGFAWFRRAGREPAQASLRVVYYLVAGHLATLSGVIRYARGGATGPWRRATNNTRGQNA